MPVTPESSVRSLSETLKPLKEKLDLSLGEIPAGTKCFAFWDFDGTLLRGDISIGKHSGEEDDYHGLVEEAVLHGLTRGYEGQEGLKQLWQDYTKKMAENYPLSHTYIADLIHKLSPENKSTLKAVADELMRTRIHHHFYPGSMEIMQYLSDRGVQHCIISASPHYLVEIGASYLPVKPAFALGVGCDDHLPEPDRFINCGEGKARRAGQVLKKASETGPAVAVFSAGNYWSSDGAMLEWVVGQGGLSLLINDQLPSLVAEQQKQSFFSLTFH